MKTSSQSFLGLFPFLTERMFFICSCAGKTKAFESHSFEAGELQAILEALEPDPLTATGARRGEIMGLQWSWVDWANVKEIWRQMTRMAVKLVSDGLLKRQNNGSMFKTKWVC